MFEQVRITVRSREKDAQYELLHDTGKTLLETMREGADVLPSLCGGMGKCGRCMVRFCGYAPFPTQSDRSMIEPDKLRKGYRLACTARPMRACAVEADFAGEKAVEEKRLHVLTGYYAMNGVQQKKGTGEPRGTLVAADIGTTTIAMQLLEVQTGRVLDTYSCFNPQRSYGMDVISRIKAANEGHEGVLKKLVGDALASGLEQLRQSAGRQGVWEPKLLSIACNTAMGHIFMGYSTEFLGKSPFLPINIKTAAVKWEGIDTVVMPGISAFVGGDIVAGLYACGLWETVFDGNKGGGDAVDEQRNVPKKVLEAAKKEEAAWLFMDLGTNAEMVMGAGGCVAATAAAAGPAFEGRGRDGSVGSERIHAVADLLKKGIVDKTGLLAEPYFETGIEVELNRPGEENRRIFVTQEDIRDIQMAKAAVRAGIHFLMKKLAVTDYSRIERVYIAGGMGFYLNTKAAVRIGLLPEELGGRMTAVGNTALAGAGIFGRCGWQEKGKDLEIYAGRAEVFNLAELTEFEEVYIGYMNFDRKAMSEIV